MKALVITGISGFLGTSLERLAYQLFPEIRIYPILSHARGGVDLAADGVENDLASMIHIDHPSETVLVHAAAVIEWDTGKALVDNARMALNVARWAHQTGIGFSILVSSVSTFPQAEMVRPTDLAIPMNLYGLGKLAAEHAWRLVLPIHRQAVVRVAGIWGWEMKPKLFWNRLLIDAVKGSDKIQPSIVKRRKSRRNYVSNFEVSECLLRVAQARLNGTLVCAGRDVVDLGQFIEILQSLPDSRLRVDFQDDGLDDQMVFEPSVELTPYLLSFEVAMQRCWRERPGWLTGR